MAEENGNPLEENGKPLIPDNGKPQKGGNPSKVDSIDPDYVVEVIFACKGNLSKVLATLDLSYPTLLKIRKKYPKVDKSYHRARKKQRVEHLYDKLFEYAEYDSRIAKWLGERLISELKPIPKKVQIGVGQNPNALPIQHEHKVGILNLDAIFEKLSLEDQQIILEHIKAQGMQPPPSITYNPEPGTNGEHK